MKQQTFGAKVPDLAANAAALVITPRADEKVDIDFYINAPGDTTDIPVSYQLIRGLTRILMKAQELVIDQYQTAVYEDIQYAYDKENNVIDAEATEVTEKENNMSNEVNDGKVLEKELNRIKTEEEKAKKDNKKEAASEEKKADESENATKEAN